MKNYLQYENERNQRNHKLYERLMRLAFGKDATILVAHHLNFELVGDEEPTEIPSADTLMFDHQLMQKVFGDNFYFYVAQLAVRPVEQRDVHLAFLLDKLEGGRLDSTPMEVTPCANV